MYCFRPLFKLSRTLNSMFNEFITNDGTFILMREITKYNWWWRIKFRYVSWYVSFWWRCLFLSNIPDFHSNSSQFFYPKNSTWLWLNVLVVLTVSNSKNCSFSLLIHKCLENSNFDCNIQYYIFYYFFHRWVLVEAVFFFYE